MLEDRIVEVGIREDQALYVKPQIATFPFIYHEEMKVHWDAGERALYALPADGTGYIEWFRRILTVAQEEGITLTVGKETDWVNIPKETQDELICIRSEEYPS